MPKRSPTELAATVGLHLQAYLREHQMSLRKLAEAAGLHYSIVHSACHGTNTRLSLASLVALADAMQMDLNTLVGRTCPETH
jgi:hypothetical protein